MTAVEPLSTAEVATAEADHYEMVMEPGHDIRCWECAEPWPCDAARALVTIHERDAEIARLEQALAGQCSYCWLERWSPLSNVPIHRFVCDRHTDAHQWAMRGAPEPAP